MTAVAPLALTMGEPAGIGAEIAMAAWLRRGEAVPPFFLLDDPERLAGLAGHLGWTVPLRTITAPEEAAILFPSHLPVLPIALPRPVVPGQPDSGNAGAVVAAIDAAVAFANPGRAAAVVTNPINKNVLYAAGFKHPGHTEYLAELAGGVQPVMMLACPELRVVPVTIHLALHSGAKHDGAQFQDELLKPTHRCLPSRGFQYPVDSAGKLHPLCSFQFQLPPAGARQAIEFRRAPAVGILPFAPNPTLVFQLMERGVERSVARLERFVRHLPEPLGDVPAAARLQVENFENQQGESALDQGLGLAHGDFLSDNHNISVT